ncbi:MAG: hypothetical protein ACHREM_10945 [Polyangiales bacterium]
MRQGCFIGSAALLIAALGTSLVSGCSSSSPNTNPSGDGGDAASAETAVDGTADSPDAAALDAPEAEVLACIEGSACIPADDCHLGVRDCSASPPLCTATSTLVPDGTPCGAGLYCARGACAACSDGAPCLPGDGCHAGHLTCASGAATCVDEGTALTDGTSCGVGKSCISGVCTPGCVDGAPCSLATGCRFGVTLCPVAGADATAPACVPSPVVVPDGTACGVDAVCLTGTCIDCKSGEPCAAATDPCHVGATSCATGALVCVASKANVTDGTTCDVGKVCLGGACVACVDGASCTPTAGTCHVGVTRCAAGASSCVDTGALIGSGMSCGVGQVCTASGACIACVAAAPCALSANTCHVGAIDCTSGLPSCHDTGKTLADGEGCGSGLVCHAGTCTSCVAGGSCPVTNPCDLGAYSCATGVKSCVDVGADPTKGGLPCGASAKGTCAGSVCVCASGYGWSGADCLSCPAFGSSVVYVDAAKGTDDGCCGTTATPGLGGPCKTVTKALSQVKGTGWYVNVTGDANGNLSGDEQYPIHLGNGVQLQPIATVFFPGVPGVDVVAFDVDDTGAALLGGTLGALAPIGGAGTPTVVGVRDAVHVGPNSAGEATGGVMGSVTIYGPARDGIHVDSGRLVKPTTLTFNDWLVHSAGRAGMYCRSETLIGSASTVGYANFAFDGGGTYGVFAGHGCTLGVDPSIVGLKYTVNASGCPLSGVLEFGVWATESAHVTLNGAIGCVASDGLSLRSSVAYATESPTVAAPFGLIVRGAGCSGLYVETGAANLASATISHAHYGVTQRSALASVAATAPSISLAGLPVDPAHGIDFACNGSSNPGACCVAGSCPPGADIFNNSGLPLDARFSTFTSTPATCTCNAALTSCTCTGSAAGSATPPDGIAVINAPLSAGTPTTDVSGAFVVTGPTCH